MYASVILGPGLIYRQMDNAIRVKDVHYMCALLLPMMGLFKLTAKQNLCRQCFFLLLRLMSAPQRLACGLMANLCVWESNRWLHAIATDKSLERMVGEVKNRLGSVRATAAPLSPG